jgi:hypothetical protein
MFMNLRLYILIAAHPSALFAIKVVLFIPRRLALAHAFVLRRLGQVPRAVLNHVRKDTF